MAAVPDTSGNDEGEFMNSTYSSGFVYHVFTQGQQAILPPEGDCPYPKVQLPDRDGISQSISRALQDHPLDGRDQEFTIQCCTIEFQKIASDDLFANKEVCGYHLAKALSSLVLELYTGQPGRIYGDFYPVMHSLIEEWAWSRHDTAEMAHSILDPLLHACSTGGTTDFAATLSKISKELFKRKRRIFA